MLVIAFIFEPVYCWSPFSRPAVHHVITAVSNLSALVPNEVAGGLQERVTLWPTLTEGVNNVFS